MALRRITIDIDDAGQDQRGRLRYGLSITTSEDGTQTHDDLLAGKLKTLVEFKVQEMLESLPVWQSN